MDPIAIACIVTGGFLFGVAINVMALAPDAPRTHTPGKAKRAPRTHGLYKTPEGGWVAKPLITGPDPLRQGKQPLPVEGKPGKEPCIACGKITPKGGYVCDSVCRVAAGDRHPKGAKLPKSRDRLVA